MRKPAHAGTSDQLRAVVGRQVAPGRKARWIGRCDARVQVPTHGVRPATCGPDPERADLPQGGSPAHCPVGRRGCRRSALEEVSMSDRNSSILGTQTSSSPAGVSGASQAAIPISPMWPTWAIATAMRAATRGRDRPPRRSCGTARAFAPRHSHRTRTTRPPAPGSGRRDRCCPSRSRTARHPASAGRRRPTAAMTGRGGRGVARASPPARSAPRSERPASPRMACSRRPSHSNTMLEQVTRT